MYVGRYFQQYIKASSYDCSESTLQNPSEFYVIIYASIQNTFAKILPMRPPPPLPSFPFPLFSPEKKNPWFALLKERNEGPMLASSISSAQMCGSFAEYPFKLWREKQSKSEREAVDFTVRSLAVYCRCI